MSTVMAAVPNHFHSWSTNSSTALRAPAPNGYLPSVKLRSHGAGA